MAAADATGTAARPARSGWLEFWSQPHSVYVNRRHLEAHCRRIADDLRALLGARFRPIVLDYGCGEALSAPNLAAACGRLYLFDAAAPTRDRLAARFGGRDDLAVLDAAGLDALGRGSIDVAVLCSVIQYLDRAELDRTLGCLAPLLAPGGELIVADVIPPDAGVIGDAVALLGSGLGHGFFWAAVRGLAATLVSDYRTLRAALGLARYTPAELTAILAGHGVAAECAPRNVGFNRGRFTLRARKPI